MKRTKNFYKDKISVVGSLVVALATLSLVSCADMFQEKIGYPSDGMAANLSSLVVGEKTDTVLLAPPEIHASLYESPDTIRIAWTGIAAAKSYRLERAIVTERNEKGEFDLPDESDFEVFEHSKAIYGTSWTDKIIKGGYNDSLDFSNPKYDYAYFYRVCAENAERKLESSEYTYSAMAALLPPPRTLTASLGESEDTIKVTWNKVQGASRYHIYRTAMDDGTGSERIAETTGNQTWFEDTIGKSNQGKEMYYTICAVSRKGSSLTSSVKSPLILGYTLLSGAPAMVNNVQVVGRGDITAKDGVKISWGRVNNTKEIKYSIYRSSSVDSALLRLKEGLTTLNFTDTKDLKPNVYYYYRIQAYYTDDEGIMVRGTMSDTGVDGKNPAEAFIISPPPSVGVTKSLQNSSSVTIKFGGAIGDRGYLDDSGLYNDYKNYTYVIFGGQTQNGSFNEIARVSGGPLNAEGFYTKDVQSMPFYKMQTVNGAKLSDYTEVVAPAPYAATDVYATKAGAVNGKANENGVLPVRITWKEPQGGAAGGYYIYRSTKPTQGFKRINDNPVYSLEYIDAYDAAKPGVVYFYKVLSLNSLKQGANYSEVDEPVLSGNVLDRSKGRGIGWGALTAYQFMREYAKTSLSSRKKLTLMHKGGTTAKLGNETVYGSLSGSLNYNAYINGLSGDVIMTYTDYADFYANNDPKLGRCFVFNGATKVNAGMDLNGSMSGTITVSGMYPARVSLDSIQIKGGGAGGGHYSVTREGFGAENVTWIAGEK